MQRELIDAKAGSVAAASRLANHYLWAVSDREQAIVWLRWGAQLKDPWAMVNLASMLQGQGDQVGCEEAEAWLIAASTSNASPGLKKVVLNHLQILREGFEGYGSCIKWLRHKGAAAKTALLFSEC